MRRRRGGRRGRTDSGSCWISLGLHPVGIGGKECERVLEERGAERGRGGRREEEEEEMGAVSAPSLSLSLWEEGLKWRKHEREKCQRWGVKGLKI